MTIPQGNEKQVKILFSNKKEKQNIKQWYSNYG